MRSITLTLLSVSLLFVAGGCKRRHKKPEIVTDARASDPDVADRFAEGFFNVEAGTWRWTAKQFTVILNPPANSAQRGAHLVVHLTVPDPVIANSKVIELSCSVSDLKLDPQVFAKAGGYTYERDIPADKLQGKDVHIDFAVDHTLPGINGDMRQLGIIVSEVGLESK
jgi:hypothetical protein